MTGSLDDVTRQLNSPKKYEDITSYYENQPYRGRVENNVGYVPIYHILSDPPASEGGYDRWKIFSTNQLSDVIPSLYGNVSGTCLYHLSCGVLSSYDIVSKTPMWYRTTATQ